MGRQGQGEGGGGCQIQPSPLLAALTSESSLQSQPRASGPRAFPCPFSRLDPETQRGENLCVGVLGPQSSWGLRCFTCEIGQRPLPGRQGWSEDSRVTGPTHGRRSGSADPPRLHVTAGRTLPSGSWGRGGQPHALHAPGRQPPGGAAVTLPHGPSSALPEQSSREPEADTLSSCPETLCLS